MQQSVVSQSCRQSATASVATVPRPDPLYHMGDKIPEPKRLSKVKLSIGFQFSHMRPTSGHQQARDISLSRFINRREGRAIRENNISD